MIWFSFDCCKCRFASINSQSQESSLYLSLIQIHTQSSWFYNKMHLQQFFTLRERHPIDIHIHIYTVSRRARCREEPKPPAVTRTITTLSVYLINHPIALCIMTSYSPRSLSLPRHDKSIKSINMRSPTLIVQGCCPMFITASYHVNMW